MSTPTGFDSPPPGRPQARGSRPGTGDMLSVRGVQVTYGGTVRALRGVDLEVGEGEVVAVLGSNGAGKTTLLRALSGTLRMHRGRVDDGSITFIDQDLAGR